MPNCDFYSIGQDHRAVLEYLISQADCEIFESYSRYDTELKQFCSVADFEQHFAITDWSLSATESIHLQLYPRDAKGTLIRSRIDPDGDGPAAAFDIGNPNFNFHSLRGTAVVRWEYRPGSTVFFVWTQDRSGSDTFGDFDFSRDRSALLRDRPVNVFQIKASYWLGI